MPGAMKMEGQPLHFSYLGLLCGSALESTANILETKTMTGAVSSLLHFINAKKQKESFRASQI